VWGSKNRRGFPKDFSLGLMCYMLGTCQKLAFWEEFDTISFQSVLKLSKKKPPQNVLPVQKKY